jgi:hypothetical protein
MPGKGKQRAKSAGVDGRSGHKRKRASDISNAAPPADLIPLEGADEAEGGATEDRLASKWDEEKRLKKAKKEAEQRRLDEKDLLYDEEDGNYQEEAGEDKMNEAGDEIVPFNLKGDEEDGFYDAGGAFVWKKDKDAVVQEDAWLEENASASALEATRVAHAAREQAERAAEMEAEEQAEGATALEARLYRLLQPGESVARALQRLGPQKIAGGGARTRRTVLTGQAKADFEAVASAADQLLAAGSMDVYQAKREAFARAAAREVAAAELAAERATEAAVVAGAAAAGHESVQWEYRSADGALQGPFSTQHVLAWRAQGYFTGAHAVQMRRVTVGGAKDATAAAPKQGKAAVDDLLDDLDDDDDVPMDQDMAQYAAWTSSDAIDFTKS